MKTVAHWVLAVFCAFISLAALVGDGGSPDSGGWRPAVSAFLPICFLFVGFTTAPRHREPRECPRQGTSNPRGPSVPHGAFTLLELLVVIAIIAVLTALLLSALSAAKARAWQARCINNLKQLSLGVKLYVEDNDDVYPGVASRLYGWHPEDWIYWRTNTALYPPFEQSPIVRAMGHTDRSLFRCPGDRDDSDRLSVPIPADGPYLFSYSFTGYGLGLDAYAQVGTTNYGMSSVYKGDVNNPDAYPFKEASVRNPSRKIMLAEEPGTISRNENPPLSNGLPIQDGRWRPGDQSFSDFLTMRHAGKADVAFADGHVAAVDWRFGTNPVNSRPDL